VDNWFRLVFLISVVFFRLDLTGSILDLLFFGHLKRFDHFSRVGVRANAVNVNLVLLNVVNQKVGWVESDDGSLVAVDFDGEHNGLQLLVDQSDQV